MSLNINALASRITLPGVSLSQVITIVGKLVSFIVLVEQVASDLKGDQKLQTVLAMMQNFLESLGFADNVKAILDELSWVAGFVVKVYNFLKLWPSAMSSSASGGSGSSTSSTAGAVAAASSPPSV